MRIYLWTGLVIVYLVVRFLFSANLDGLGIYASYVFEALLVTLAAALTGRSFLKLWSLPQFSIKVSILSLILGAGVSFFAKVAHIPIPFDLGAAETLIFLLIIAPILEELVFRFFLWIPVERLAYSSKTAWQITSLLFAYAHLHAIWFVGPEFHSFIIYQTAYTFFLGLMCGYFVRNGRSLTAAMLIHFAFNLGFYFGTMI